MGTEILSSPRRAFERAASSILARRMPSSNSLMLPFIPSNKRSLGATRVIDTVEIGDARLDEPTELQKVMPIAAVPGEPRGVEAKNGANLAGAQPRLKSGPGDGAARRATEVVVDDFDVAKSASAGLVNELILTPLALQVDLHLGLR